MQCPLLCKEFIVDAWQLYYARLKGADAVLLIAAVLPDLDIKYMLKICKILGMAALVEVHDEREMDRVLGIDGVQLIGINNRNLETFQVDISNTKNLLEGERGQTIAQKGIIVSASLT
jgi:indole-3-glycerol phosphate synthase